MSESLLQQGLELMLVGMGTVFVFLTLLVIAMSVLATLVAKRSPIGHGDISDEEVAAITIAIARHRNKHS